MGFFPDAFLNESLDCLCHFFLIPKNGVMLPRKQKTLAASTSAFLCPFDRRSGTACNTAQTSVPACIILGEVYKYVAWSQPASAEAARDRTSQWCTVVTPENPLHTHTHVQYWLQSRIFSIPTIYYNLFIWIVVVGEIRAVVEEWQQCCDETALRQSIGKMNELLGHWVRDNVPCIRLFYISFYYFF